MSGARRLRKDALFSKQFVLRAVVGARHVENDELIALETPWDPIIYTTVISVIEMTGGRMLTAGPQTSS